jgi:hypothetical protein
MLGYTFQTWALLDSDQDIICSACGKLVPPGVMALSHMDSRSRVYCCYTADCIIKHPLNHNIDSIKIHDIQAGIALHKTAIVRRYGIEYWQRNKMIPLGYEEFERSYSVK